MDLGTKYPWLVGPSLWLGERPYNHYNDIPEGWRIAFGERWCKDIQAEYEKMSKEEQEDFFVVQLKEKFGSFRQYFSTGNDAIFEITRKYEELSERTCIHCGAPATRISRDWISPWCDEHAPEGSLPIEE